MIILAIRTDSPEAEAGLYDDKRKLAHETWQAHRELAETLHVKISALLTSGNLEWQNVKGIVAYEGPGSFTGLRIGLSVANALAYSLRVPIVGSTGEEWVSRGIESLKGGSDNITVLPVYGAEPNITKPVK